MRNRAAMPILLAFVAGCASQAIHDPIPDVPLSQQRAVTRSDFGWRWPFTVGVGTLGCHGGAVIFRQGGFNHALNKAAASRAYTPVERIQRREPTRPPSNPLGRLKQEERTRIFAASAACDGQPCRDRLRQVHGVSEAELAQIEAEGRERIWPPLERKPMDLGPVVEAGLKLCEG